MDEAMKKALSEAEGAARTIASCPKNRDEEIAKIVHDFASGKMNLHRDRNNNLSSSVYDPIEDEYKVKDTATVIKAAQTISKEDAYLALEKDVTHGQKAGYELQDYVEERAKALGVKGEPGKDTNPNILSHRYHDNDLEHVKSALSMTNPHSGARADRVKQEGCAIYY